MLDDFELSDDEMHLYSRQILLDGWDLDAQEKLKLANVLIVGCGGIGCQTAALLVRAGVGKITLCDPDQIEISNLQRQMAFHPEHVGRYKAEVLAEQLKHINPFVDVIAHSCAFDAETSEILLREQDLVLDGCDDFATRYLVNQSCVQQAIPLISASAIGFEGQMLMVLPEHACYACLFPAVDAEQNIRCAETGVLATTPNVMASLQAHHALLYLGLGESPLAEKILLWNGRNLLQKIRSFSTDPDCIVCQAK